MSVCLFFPMMHPVRTDTLWRTLPRSPGCSTLQWRKTSLLAALSTNRGNISTARYYNQIQECKLFNSSAVWHVFVFLSHCKVEISRNPLSYISKRQCICGLQMFTCLAAEISGFQNQLHANLMFKKFSKLTISILTSSYWIVW